MVDYGKVRSTVKPESIVIDEFSVWKHTDIQEVSENVGTDDEFIGYEYNMIQYTKDEFILDSKATVGVEFSSKCVKVKNSVIKAQIWDTGNFIFFYIYFQILFDNQQLVRSDIVQLQARNPLIILIQICN